MIPTTKKIKVNKNGKIIDIFYPCTFSENYIHYRYQYVDDNSINLHQWRMLYIYLAAPDMSDTITIGWQCEWEGVVLEEGAKDFMGGYHGDENNLSLSILADTRLYPTDGDFSIECNYLRLTAVSYLNRCDTPGDNVFLRYKTSSFDAEGYTVANRFELLQDLEINRFENIMMGFPLKAGDKRFISYAASNTHPDPKFISLDSSENISNPIFAGDHYAKDFEVFAPDFGFHAQVRGIFDAEKYPNGFRVVDNWRVRSDCTFKVYYNMTGKYSAKKGEIFDWKAIYTLEG